MKKEIEDFYDKDGIECLQCGQLFNHLNKNRLCDNCEEDKR